MLRFVGPFIVHLPVGDRRGYAFTYPDKSFQEMHTALLLACEAGDNSPNDWRRLTGDENRLVLGIE
jgi:hypothetical protein